MAARAKRMMINQEDKDMRNIIRKFITALAFATFAAATAWAQPSLYNSGGSYRISSAADWRVFANYINNHDDTDYNCYLDNDISFENQVFVPIGNANHPFKGSLNGRNLTISHVTYSTSDGYVGLVGNLGSKGSVERVRLDNSSFCGGSNVGGIVGYINSYMTSEGGRVENCFVFNTTVSLYDESNDKSCGVIVGDTGGWYVVSGNYYNNCKKATSAGNYTYEIGYGFNSDPNLPNMDGGDGHAQVMGRLSLPSGVTTDAQPVFTSASGSDNYYAGTITLSEPPAGYIYSVNGQAITGNSFTINADAVVTFAPDPDHFSQNGDLYTIKDATGWNVFCDLLENNDYGYFSNKIVQLLNHIIINRMAGSSGHEFTGTFNGYGYLITFNYTATEEHAAPFRYVKDATIKSVRVTGTITTSAKYAAGIIACQNGTVTLQNCRSSITISSSISGDGTHGGLVAEAAYNNVLTIEGCVFDGKLLGTSTTSCGGFVGWNNNQTTISDCLFVPAEITVGTSESATFARGNNAPSVTRSYYTTGLGSTQGTQALVTATEPAGLGAQGTQYSNYGITSYANGLYWDGKYYYVTPAAWSDSNNEYTINNADDWGTFCDLLANKAKGYFNNKTVKLGADITVTRMAGEDYHDFSGIFDGQGHTLTFNYTATEDYAAPFRYVNWEGVTKNLHTAGTITTSAQYAAGIIAYQGSPVTITNCRSSITISSSKSGAGFHGGFVARQSEATNASLTIEGCVFDGKIVSTGAAATTGCGGFVGWKGSAGTLTITDCLYAPQADANEVKSDATFSKNWSGTPTNSYYTQTLGAAQGPATIITTDKPANIGAMGSVYSVSGITAYANGLYRGGNYYSANPSFDQNLTLVEGKVATIVKSSSSVAAYKYVGTFYHATLHYQLPAGAMAYTAKYTNAGWEFYRIGTDGNIIPAGTAVVIVSDAASIELIKLESDPGITAGSNDLQGSDVAVDNSNNDKYVLGRLNGDKDLLGFYKYSGSSIPAGKAYYVPQN